MLYYLCINIFADKNDNEYWDKLLVESWDDLGRTWPNRCKEIQQITKTDDKILDVGCGTGSILRTLKSNGYLQLYGLEHSAVAVERLSAVGIHMKNGQLPNIAYDDNCFDVVIASEVLEHVLFHRKFIKEIMRVLRPGGVALIYVPNCCMGPIDEPSHVRMYSGKSLDKLLKKYCNVISITETSERYFEATFLCAKVTKYIEKEPVVGH